MKKKKMKGCNEMTDKQFVKLLDEIWHMVQKRRRANSKNLLRKVTRTSIDKRKEGE